VKMITLRVKETATGGQINSPRDVYESIKEIGQADQETFWVIGYNEIHKEVFRKCLFMGGINHTTVDPKIVFKRLLLYGASSWIALHNHPSGKAYPSTDDLVITENLRKGSEILGLKMLDHLIIGDNTFYSFAEHFWNRNGHLNYEKPAKHRIRPRGLKPISK